MAVEALAWKLSGCLVRELDPSGAVAKDGRIKTGRLANILLQSFTLHWNEANIITILATYSGVQVTWW